jgi:hypothetical protein
MEKVIVIVGCVLLAIAIVGLLTGGVEDAVSDLLTRTITDINAVNP